MAMRKARSAKSIPMTDNVSPYTLFTVIAIQTFIGNRSLINSKG